MPETNCHDQLKQQLSMLEEKNSELETIRRTLDEQVEQYRRIFQMVADAIFLIDNETGRILEVNDTASAMYGYSKEEFLDLKNTDLSAEPDKTRKAVQQAKTTVPVRYHRKKDGTVFPVEITATHLVWKGREAHIAAIRDITDRKHAEEELAQIFSMSLDLICIADINTSTFLKVNPAFTATLGFSEKELLNRTFLNFIHPDDIDSTALVVEQKLRLGKKVVHYENRYRCKDGTYRWLSWVSHPNPEKGITYAVARDITDLKHTEQKLQESKALLDATGRMAKVGGWQLDAETLKVSWTEETYRIHEVPLHYNPPLKEAIDFFHPDDREILSQAINEALDNGTPYDMELRFITSKDNQRWVRTICRPVMENGKTVRLLGTVQDITDLKEAQEEKAKIEKQLYHSQKMEATGRLAGGIAHDFNNMLSIISGNAEMALEDIPPESLLSGHLKEIRTATERSANLVKQLLAFARKQTIDPKVLNLNDTLQPMLKMLKRLIGENIELAWKPGNHLWPVKIDPSQIDQVLANLCVNARDAIHDVGTIVIETGNITFHESRHLDNEDIQPGSYVMIAVSDSGCGMNPETLSNLFEPFYTTKDISRRSGLGLATVYGIVKQNKGFINLYSEPGKGTTFKLYFPRYEIDSTIRHEETHSVEESETETGHETILLVEDEKAILRMVSMMLERLGYNVLKASNPAEAIDLADSHPGTIHLLMTDVIMPDMNGRELSEKLMLMYPQLKSLYISGYTANIIEHQGVVEKEVHFLQKPFDRKKLAEKIRTILDQTDQ